MYQLRHYPLFPSSFLSFPFSLHFPYFTFSSVLLFSLSPSPPLSILPIHSALISFSLFPLFFSFFSLLSLLSFLFSLISLLLFHLFFLFSNSGIWGIWPRHNGQLRQQLRGKKPHLTSYYSIVKLIWITIQINYLPIHCFI